MTTIMHKESQSAAFRPQSGRKRATLEQRRNRLLYLMITPWIFGFLVFTAGPMIYSFYISLTRWNLLTPPRFIGAKNYTDLMKDPLFWQSLKVTTIYAFVSVPLDLLVALLLAILLNQKVRGLSIFRTILYLPSVVSGVAVSILFMWVFNPDFGLINAMLASIGITGPGWIGDPDWALPSLVVMSFWTVGGTMLIFLAGLQNVPVELQEAASIDGAGPLRKFFRITLPLLTPTILFNLVLAIIGQFQTFTQAFVMTKGGPQNATLFYVLQLFVQAFENMNMGYASAMAWVLFLIILVLTIVVMNTSGKWVFYQGENDK
jgi:multiple sugar transport system permease protein